MMKIAPPVEASRIARPARPPPPSGYYHFGPPTGLLDSLMRRNIIPTPPPSGRRSGRQVFMQNIRQPTPQTGSSSLCPSEPESNQCSSSAAKSSNQMASSDSEKSRVQAAKMISDRSTPTSLIAFQSSIKWTRHVDLCLQCLLRHVIRKWMSIAELKELIILVLCRKVDESVLQLEVGFTDGKLSFPLLRSTMVECPSSSKSSGGSSSGSSATESKSPQKGS